MRVALCSDAHLGGPDDPGQARFLRFLGGLRADHLVLAGDVFQHWWHFGADPFPAYAPVVEALARFPLTVLPGNHDFTAPAWFAAHQGALIPGADGWVRTEWDGLAVQLHHGDHVDRSLGYRAACAVLRGGPFGAAVTAMGPERAWRFLGSLTGHGAVRLNEALVEAQVRDAEVRLGGGGLVVFGHTHAPGRYEADRGVYLNLGALTGTGTWGLVEEGRVRLMRWEDGD